LSDGDGLDIVREGGPPVVAITRSPTEAERRRVLKAGAVAHLAELVSLSTLTTAVESALESR